MNIRNEFHFLRIIMWTIILWLTIIVNAFSQDYLFDIEFIGVEDGLPHRNTYNIVQDKEGFIWVSTLEGISRYDGYRFKNYSHTDLKVSEFRLPYRLAIDATNQLWYFSGSDFAEEQLYGGIINSSRDSISTIETLSEGYFATRDITYIGNAKPGSTDVIIATRSGRVYEYDKNFREIYRAPHPFLRNVTCRANPDGSYWITHGGEVILVKDGKRLQHIKSDYNIEKNITTHPSLILKLFDNRNINFVKLENDKLIPFTLPGYAPKDITGLLWFHKDYNCYATKNTLFVKDTLGNIMYSFNDFKSLKFQQRLDFEATFLDRKNTLWVSTINGLVKINSRKNPFKVVASKYSTRGIYREGEQLWIGYAGSVVRNVVTGMQKKFWPFRIAPITSFCKDDKKNLWMGTDMNVLVKYIQDQDLYIRYYIRPYKGAYLRQLFRNPVTKTWWIGTKNGIFRMEMGNEVFRTATAANDSIVITDKNILNPFSLPISSTGVRVRQFYQNTAGMWIITSKGIFLMDSKEERILKHYTTADGLPTNDVNYLYEDTGGIFWLGTKSDGLIQWDVASNSFTQYTRENGLSNNRIYAVYEDEYETLWLPSDYGLMAFDKTTATTIVYLPQNGIAHEEFNTFSHFQDKDGTLYFGGLNGVTMFHPKNLQEEKTISLPLYVTGVRMLKKDAETYTDQTLTYKTTQKISLDSGDRILELDLSLLDYKQSAENQFAYKLSGKQQQWLYTTDNKLSIINPPYGRYNLIIKARGASGQWSENQLIIPMHVKAPFYLRWWFIFILTLFIIATIIIFVQWRIRKLKRDRVHLEGEVQKRTRKIAQDKKIIEQQAEELRALDKAKSRFFANITHEFRTPLTLVTGPVERMLSKQLPNLLKKELNGVLKNGQNLLSLINQLLDLSKLESGQMQVEVAHGDIVRYTRELVYRFQSPADTKQLQLEFTTGKDIWKIHFDSDKWTKIIYNLLSNAVKFTFKGYITVHLKEVQQSDQQYLQLTVKDTGIGINPENRAHIFDRFYQADASSTRLQGGTGIGLSLVKELVELQKGTVTVSSTADRGTEFTVCLPVLPAPYNEPAMPPLAVEANLLPLSNEVSSFQNSQEITTNAREKSPVEKLELLIVEDNAGMRTYIRSCIDETIYHITEAAHGEAGLEKALEKVPDLIISDVMMPKKNGFELTQAIRNHIATSHIPLILLTARASLENRLKGLERGADTYLTKPFSPEELRLRIKNLIELRRLLQKRYQSFEVLPGKEKTFQKEDLFFKELKNYIFENISNPNLGSEAVTTHFAISRTQLYRKLKALANTSLTDYIRSVRLNKAIQLLEQQQLNVSEVAYETGFSSPEHFSRTFKKMYGKSPSKW